MDFAQTKIKQQQEQLKVQSTVMQLSSLSDANHYFDEYSLVKSKLPGHITALREEIKKGPPEELSKDEKKCWKSEKKTVLAAMCEADDLRKSNKPHPLDYLHEKVSYMNTNVVSRRNHQLFDEAVALIGVKPLNLFVGDTADVEPKTLDLFLFYQQIIGKTASAIKPKELALLEEQFNKLQLTSPFDEDIRVCTDSYIKFQLMAYVASLSLKGEAGKLPLSLVNIKEFYKLDQYVAATGVCIGVYISKGHIPMDFHEFDEGNPEHLEAIQRLYGNRQTDTIIKGKHQKLSVNRKTVSVSKEGASFYYYSTENYTLMNALLRIQKGKSIDEKIALLKRNKYLMVNYKDMSKHFSDYLPEQQRELIAVGEEHNENLANAFLGENAELTENMTLYRGSFPSNFANWNAIVRDNPDEMIGKTLIDHAYQSTSTTKGSEFEADVKLTIHAPQGTKGVWIKSISRYPSENETLLAPGTRLRIDKVEVSETEELVDWNPVKKKKYNFKVTVV